MEGLDITTFTAADALASANFVIQGDAEVKYDSSVVNFASFGFPGLY